MKDCSRWGFFWWGLGCPLIPKCLHLFIFPKWCQFLFPFLFWFSFFLRGFCPFLMLNFLLLFLLRFNFQLWSLLVHFTIGYLSFLMGWGGAKHNIPCYGCGSLFLQWSMVNHQKHYHVFHVLFISNVPSFLVSPLGSFLFLVVWA